MDCSFGIYRAANRCLNDFEVMSMAEKCRFSECSMHMCHGERCKGCCNSTENEKEITRPVTTIKERVDIYANLEETIKNCSDAQLFRLQRLLQAEKLKRKSMKLKPHTRRGSARGQKLEEQVHVHIKLDNDGKRKRAILIKEIKPKPPFDDKS